jgi:hypothetical protein
VWNIGNDNYIVTAISQKQFGLIDVRHRGLEENATADKVMEASSTISEIACCGLHLVL